MLKMGFYASVYHTNKCVECDLQSSYLGGADLSGATLEGANLSNANLKGADLMDAIMNSVILCNTTMSDGSVI